MPYGNVLLRTPWSDQLMSEDQFRREYEPTDQDALIGCSCDLPNLVVNEPAPGAVLEHAPNCPLYSF